MKGKKNNILLGSGLITAIASSLCCITPILALIAGTSGAASSISWMETFRPYLIGFTIIVLGFAWYQKLKQKKSNEIECNCEVDDIPGGESGKEPFMQTKLFLGMITVFAILMLTFPYYSTIFYPKSNSNISMVNPFYMQTIEFEIEGMTCTACENHIEHAVNEVKGVLEIKVSYKKHQAVIQFDTTQVDSLTIANSINQTGYKIRNDE